MRVSATGDYTIQPGYYFYKQLSRAGQPGMAVAAVATTSGSQVDLITFASNGTPNPDAFVALNTGRTSQRVKTTISGSSARSFKGFRTDNQLEEKYADIGIFEVRAGSIEIELPAGAVATFFADAKQPMPPHPRASCAYSIMLLCRQIFLCGCASVSG